jgi:hypothetical protein
MADRFLSDFVGTLKTFVRVAGLRLVNTTDTAIEIKDKTGAAFRDLRSRAISLRTASGTNEVKLQIPSDPGDNVTLNLPVTAGSTGQVLTTDGTGTLSWSTVSMASNQVLSQQETVVYNASSPIPVFTPPANATVLSVVVEVETAFNATGVTLAVGVAGTTSRYMGVTDNDLSTVASYEVQPLYEESASPSAVIITFSAGSGGSQGTARVTVNYANPT